MKARFFKLLLIWHVSVLVFAFNCRETLENNELKSIGWENLKKCLAEVNGEVVSTNMSENIWRLTKNTFNGIENIPVETFALLGYSLTAIPLEEMRNLSMERVEMVEAFGAIRTADKLQGFKAEQSALIAQKVQDEWLGKNSDTYSEYDLISMGEILCHLNATVIEAIHADAFKNGVEWIGNIKDCPQTQLEALAKLAKDDDAFGDPSNWSTLIVAITGNIINGLPQSDIASIDKDKLRINRYYRDRNNDTRARKGAQNKDATNKTTTAGDDQNKSQGNPQKEKR